MGKSRKHKSSSSSASSSAAADASSSSAHHPTGSARSTSASSTGARTSTTTTPSAAAPSTTTTTTTTISLREWISREPRGIWWVIGSILAGAALGFVLGTGWMEVFWRSPNAPVPSLWRQDLADRLRSTMTYRWITGHEGGSRVWKDWMSLPFNGWRMTQWQNRDVYPLLTNPSHPRVFGLLREAVIRERGGYVHPDLGFLVPAPSGAARGIGMVRDAYHRCQVNCIPGLADEKWKLQQALARNETVPIPPSQSPSKNKNRYKQEEILLRIPLSFQMTRAVALETLLPLVPGTKHGSLHELDDAALLVLLLAHERGVGRFSPWMPYIASLPPEPSCGYSKRLRPYMLDAIKAMRDEFGVDTQGWSEELSRATQYANRVAEGLAKDYGSHIKTPEGLDAKTNIEWSLCQVASRGTAGTPQHGNLRLVPMVDQINHDSNAGGFVELTGKERYDNGDFVIDASEQDAGAFVVRSIRHGRRKPLRKGQELLANYNVPHYAPLDWLVSLGFVPPERQTAWQKVEPALPRVRRDGQFPLEGDVGAGVGASSAASTATATGGTTTTAATSIPRVQGGAAATTATATTTTGGSSEHTKVFIPSKRSEL